MKKIVILYSGGLDSYILYHYAKNTQPDADIKAVYWDYHHSVNKEEIEALPNFVEVRKVDWMNLEGKSPVSLPNRTEGPIFVPGRNLVFPILTACQDLPDEIWLGTLGGETHNKGTDKNYQFLWTMNSTLNYVLSPYYGDKKLEVKFPFADNNMNKNDIVKWALRNGITKEQLIKTYSCHYPGHKCGKCVQCVKRSFVFLDNGFTEETLEFPPTSPMGLQIIDDLLKSVHRNGYYNVLSFKELYPGYLKYKKLVDANRI